MSELPLMPSIYFGKYFRLSTTGCGTFNTEGCLLFKIEEDDEHIVDQCSSLEEVQGGDEGEGVEGCDSKSKCSGKSVSKGEGEGEEDCSSKSQCSGKSVSKREGEDEEDCSSKSKCSGKSRSKREGEDEEECGSKSKCSGKSGSKGEDGDSDSKPDDDEDTDHDGDGENEGSNDDSDGESDEGCVACTQTSCTFPIYDYQTCSVS